MILARQFAGPDVQPHRQGVGLHIHLQGRCQLCGSTAPERPLHRDKGGYGLQHRVGGFYPQLCFHPLQCPCQVFLVLGEIEPLVLLVTSYHIQNGGVIRPLLLLKKKGPIRRSRQSVGAGDHIKLVIGLLFPSVMYQQETNAAGVSEVFQLSHYLIIVGVAVFIPASLPDFLEGVNDNQLGVGVFLHEPL